jgi:hypothetical protein
MKVINRVLAFALVGAMAFNIMGCGKKTSDNKEVKKDPKLEAIKAAYKEKETEIKNKLKTKVTIKDSGNKGQIVISYGSLDEFERLYKILNK